MKEQQSSIKDSNFSAEQLNQQCQCVAQSHQALGELLCQQGDDGSIYDMIVNERSNLIAKARVFISAHCLQKQRDIIMAIETVIAMPTYQQYVLDYAPEVVKWTPLSRQIKP